MIKGLIFDLDGVIVDTAKYHFHAWQRLAQSLGVDFTEAQNEQLKGVSRRGSIDKILAWGNLQLSEQEIEDLMHKKNVWYLDFMNDMNPSEILSGVENMLKSAKKLQLKIALGSASKNAPIILEKTNLTHYFDAIIDGNVVSASKPDPQVFTQGAKALGLKNNECLVFEDATAGVEAALNGGMKVVGIGQRETLHKAHLVLPDFKDIDLTTDILEKI